MAKLGDAYVNFIFSLGRSKVLQEPQGIKVSDKILAEALRKSGLRKELPYRTTRQDCANAVEALLVYGYLNGVISLEETIEKVTIGGDSPVDLFADLAQLVASRLNSRKPINS